MNYLGMLYSIACRLAATLFYSLSMNSFSLSLPVSTDSLLTSTWFLRVTNRSGARSLIHFYVINCCLNPFCIHFLVLLNKTSNVKGQMSIIFSTIMIAIIFHVFSKDIFIQLKVVLCHWTFIPIMETFLL